MRAFGSHMHLSPTGGRPTRDAQELRRATSLSELVRARGFAIVTSAGARHISCARGASSGRQPEKGAAHVERQRHPRPSRSHDAPSAHRFIGSALARVALEPARRRLSSAGSAARLHRGLLCAVCAAHRRGRWRLSRTARDRGCQASSKAHARWLSHCSASRRTRHARSRGSSLRGAACAR